MQVRTVPLLLSMVMLFVAIAGYGLGDEWQFSAFLAVYNLVLFIGWDA